MQKQLIIQATKDSHKLRLFTVLGTRLKTSNKYNGKVLKVNANGLFPGRFWRNFDFLRACDLLLLTCFVRILSLSCSSVAQTLLVREVVASSFVHWDIDCSFSSMTHVAC